LVTERFSQRALANGTANSNQLFQWRLSDNGITAVSMVVCELNFLDRNVVRAHRRFTGTGLLAPLISWRCELCCGIMHMTSVFLCSVQRNLRHCAAIEKVPRMNRFSSVSMN
jgi:hypothetical protein